MDLTNLSCEPKALRILGRLSSDLPAVHLDRLVEALPHERDNLDPLAARAVEVADVIAAPLRSPQRGETFAASVNRIAAATVTTIVLEDLVQYVLGWLEEGTRREAQREPGLPNS